METLTKTLFFIAALVAAGGLCFIGGRRSAGNAASITVTTTDTLWLEVHDTCWRETAVTLSRTDTVRLAVANVHENAVSGTYTDRCGHENGISGTYTDTLFIHDSVYVEIPIEEREFAGENYRIITEGYRTRLKDVWICTPTVTNTVTKTKRWGFSAGAQIGYGYTVHGGSPYIGVGVAFGYTF